MNYKTSPDGIGLIQGHEALVLHAYDDMNPSAGIIMPGDTVIGTLSIGWGHTSTVVPGMTITAAQADELLESDLAWAEQRVNTSIDVPISQQQFDALVSHTYNTGGSDTLFDLINANAPDEAIKEWWTEHYIWSQGVELAGLVKRRAEEYELFRTGEYPQKKKS